MKPAPAFLCYASNIIANKQYRLMMPLERSIWVSIYLECWPNRAVPADPIELAKYLGFSVADVKVGLTANVLSFFKEINGELICPELEEYRETQRERNLKKSLGGKKGAERKRRMASSRVGNVEGVPKGSLIQSNLIQTKPNQSLKNSIIPLNDNFVKEMEAYDKASKGF